MFGVADVLATRSLVIDDTLDGGIDGDPCFGVHKLAHVNEWLALRDTRLDALEQSWFYSDSASDLPLLEAVSDAVAVAPDERLRARAIQCGWPVIERG